MGYSIPATWMISDRSSVKGSLRRFAPWTGPGRSEGRPLFTRGKGGVGPWGAERREVSNSPLAHDKGYYHSYCGGESRKEPFGHTSHLSRGRGALSPAGP